MSYSSKYPFQSLLSPEERVTEEQLATERNILAFDRTISHLNRRNFLGAMMTAAVATTLSGSRSAKAQSSGPSVTDVLNFALNLEYLEANFYLYVSTGTGLNSTLSLGGAPVQGAPGMLPLDMNTMDVCQALAQDEVGHIADLQSTITSLGGTPIPQPVINLAAHGPITTQAQFIAAARQFTALGGSAYVGSAKLLVSNPTVLSAAAQILGAEGQHAGAIAYLCISQNIVSPPIDALDIPPTQSQYFTVNPTTALSPYRSPQQVLGVAYGVSDPTTTIPTAGVTMGGFFPNGVAGAVQST